MARSTRLRNNRRRTARRFGGTVRYDRKTTETGQGEKEKRQIGNAGRCGPRLHQNYVLLTFTGRFDREKVQSGYSRDLVDSLKCWSFPLVIS